MQINTVATIHIHQISLLDKLQKSSLDMQNIDNEVHVIIKNFFDLLTLYNCEILSKNTILELYMEKIDKIVFLNIFKNIHKYQIIKETT